MISDTLQQEIFVNSPTFRRQVASALTTVGITRWKAATATVMTVDALAAQNAATTEQLIARQVAKTERTFIENALAVQGINLGGFTAPVAMPGAPDPAKEGISRMINMLLAHANWDWTVAEWIENQAGANAEIEARMNDLLASLAAVSN